MTTIENKSTGSPAKGKKKSHPFWRWFWLSFLVASLVYAWYSFYVPSNDVVWADDMVSARETAQESEKNMLLFFTGDWCAACRVMKREVFADQEVMEAINDELVSIEINIDDPAAAELVEQYNIGGTPITIFTNPNGDVLDYAVGKIGKTKFMDMMEGLN